MHSRYVKSQIIGYDPKKHVSPRQRVMTVEGYEGYVEEVAPDGTARVRTPYGTRNITPDQFAIIGTREMVAAAIERTATHELTVHLDQFTWHRAQAGNQTWITVDHNGHHFNTLHAEASQLGASDDTIQASVNDFIRREVHDYVGSTDDAMSLAAGLHNDIHMSFDGSSQHDEMGEQKEMSDAADVGEQWMWNPTSETVAAIKTAAKKFFECGGCGMFHPYGFSGDCRDDRNRFDFGQLPDGAEIVDEHTGDVEDLKEEGFRTAATKDADVAEESFKKVGPPSGPGDALWTGRYEPGIGGDLFAPGDAVEVDEPHPGDLWLHGFVGTVVGVKDGIVSVEDQDGDVWDVDRSQVKSASVKKAVQDIGSQHRETLEEAGYELVRMNGEEATLRNKETGLLELWGLSDDFAGYVIEIEGKGYEFMRDAPSGVEAREHSSVSQSMESEGGEEGAALQDTGNFDRDLFASLKKAVDALCLTPEAYEDELMTVPGMTSSRALDETIKHYRGRIPEDQLMRRLQFRYAKKVAFRKVANPYKIIESMHTAVDEGWGKIPYRKQEGNWQYVLDENYILHVTYHWTEVVTADFAHKKVTKITDGGYGSVSTHAGITRVLGALAALGYDVPEHKGYEYPGKGPEVPVDDAADKQFGKEFKHLPEIPVEDEQLS